MVLCCGTAAWLSGCAAPDHTGREALGNEAGRSLPCAVVEPGVLYRSGQLGVGELLDLIGRIGLKTIVNARGEQHDSNWYRREAEFARLNGIKLVDLDVHIARGPTLEQSEQFMALVRDPNNYPILVHCKFGVNRTGHMVKLFKAQRPRLLSDDGAPADLP